MRNLSVKLCTLAKNKKYRNKIPKKKKKDLTHNSIELFESKAISGGRDASPLLLKRVLLIELQIYNIYNSHCTSKIYFI